MSQTIEEKSVSFEDIVETFDGKKTLENMIKTTLEYIQKEQLTLIQ